jgi:hypothetical protein
MSQEPCPICCYKPVKHHLKGMDSASNRDFYSIDCPRCGKFEISGSFIEIVKNKELSSAQIGLLSGHIRDANLNHQQLTLDEYNTDANENHFEKWLSELSKTTTEKQNKLLIALEKLMPEPGETIIISLDTDISLSLAWAASKNELKFHLKTLHEREFIYLYSNGNEDLDDFAGREVKILGKGWERLEKISTDIGHSAQVFVAMRIGDNELDSTFDEFIEPAIRNSGYKPYRVDRDDKNMERIDNKIIAEIKNSRFLIADVTKHRNSVYYEAGFAQGLGIPVIWTVRKGDHLPSKMAFDTRQLPHIFWEDGQELGERLSEAILAQIGQGPIIHDV